MELEPTSLSTIIDTIERNRSRTDQKQRDSEYNARLKLVELIIGVAGDVYTREHILQMKNPTHESHQIFSDFWSPITKSHNMIQEIRLEYKQILQILYGSSENNNDLGQPKN